MCISLKTLYLCYGVKGQPGVIRGHRGQKVIFTKNAFSTDYMAWLCNSCIYIHKLETLNSIHGVKVNLGSLPPANIMRLCPDLFPDLVSLVCALQPHFELFLWQFKREGLKTNLYGIELYDKSQFHIMRESFWDKPFCFVLGVFLFVCFVLF